MLAKRWKYGSKNFGGNLHEVAIFLNEYHPEWDVVAIDRAGAYTVILYRVEIDGKTEGGAA